MIPCIAENCLPIPSKAAPNALRRRRRQRISTHGTTQPKLAPRILRCRFLDRGDRNDYPLPVLTIMAGLYRQAPVSSVHKFKKRSRTRALFRRPLQTNNWLAKGGKPPPRGRLKHWQWNMIGLATFAAVVVMAAGLPPLSADVGGPEFTCAAPQVTDGDTIRCGDKRVRLAGIDAPELPGHCRAGRECAPGDPYASTENLRRLIGRSGVTCHAVDTDRYGRTVARCSADGTDLSCAQLDAGRAIRRYGTISC